ncbi:MAG: GSCFA domain-containing protein [Ginsengibacter sp.]
MDKFMINMIIEKSQRQISYDDKIMMVGSCFSEEIGKKLSDCKFTIFQNPNGILFDPESIYRCLNSVISNRMITLTDVVEQGEVYHSMDHHSDFSSIEKENVVEKVNQYNANAHLFLKEAKWLIITFGTAWNYELIDSGQSVANCHKMPGELFHKKEMEIDEIVAKFTEIQQSLKKLNPELTLIYTVSPVRHIRNGVVNNNLSKAKLLVAVHKLVSALKSNFYFPSYELAIDVLRDYRFFDSDLVHPNSLAIDFIFEKFIQSFLDKKGLIILSEIKKWKNNVDHRPYFPESIAYKKFRQALYHETKELIEKYPFLNLDSELIQIKNES